MKKYKLSSEPSSYMIQMLKLSDREFKITMISMLRDLMEKKKYINERTDGQHLQRHGNSRKINQKGMLDIKFIVMQMKNAFDGLMSKLDTAGGESVNLKMGQ